MADVLVNFVMSQAWSTHHQSLRVQCFITAHLLLIAAVAVVTAQMLTSAVDCVADVRDLPKTLVNEMCYNQKLKVAGGGDGPNNEWNPRGYYTWSPVYLALLSILTYIPSKFWDMWENGVESNVARELNDLEDIADEQAIQRKLDIVRQAMEACVRSGYADAMLFCRFLSYFAFNISMRGTNYLLGAGFTSLDLDMVRYVLGGDAPGEAHPLDGVFPMVGMCTLHLVDDNSRAALVSTAVCQLNYSYVLGEVHFAVWFWLAAIKYPVTLSLFTTSLAYHRLGRAALVRELFEFEDERDVQLITERLHLGALLFLRQLRLRVLEPIYTDILQLIAEDLLQHQD